MSEILDWHELAFEYRNASTLDAEGWARQLEKFITGIEAERDALKAELAKHQSSEFHPDWSMLQACQDGLREHMGMIKEREADLKEQGEDFQKLSADYHALHRELQSLKEQEPVAWMYKDSCGKYKTPFLELRPDVPGYHKCWIPEPLYAQPIPAKEGYVLVPIEPDVGLRERIQRITQCSFLNSKRIYKAMLAASKE